MATYPIIQNLPVAHNREIGRLITQWALLEWKLKQIAYDLLVVEPPVGRLAVNEPRVVDYVTMLEDILRVKKLKIDVDLKKLKTALSELANHRDRIAHGVWLKRPKTRSPDLQIIKGSWQPDPNKPKVKAVIHPRSVTVRVQDLQILVAKVKTLIEIVDVLTVQVRHALASSLQKSSELPAWLHPAQDSTPAIHQYPPGSSQG
ncbi:MAG: hypothetical protein O6924_10175 [Alphaproteobacteria bacterium]|nr:hypothetical protein [Alphaproteobacteria bacterium]